MQPALAVRHDVGQHLLVEGPREGLLPLLLLLPSEVGRHPQAVGATGPPGRERAADARAPVAPVDLRQVVNTLAPMGSMNINRVQLESEDFESSIKFYVKN